MSAPAADRSGILAGGNWLIDHVKVLDTWPPQDTLANILAESWGNGGAPYNVLKDLARLGVGYPLSGVGLLGADADGERILEDCRRHGINTDQVGRTTGAPTSYSDVMTVQSTGRRTFFHQRGANALLGPEHFDFSATRARVFHLGYLLLLDRLDHLEHGRPRAADVLRRARTAGLLTALDCVSEPSDRFQRIVAPVLPEVDVLFANDFEAEKLTGIALRDPHDQRVRRSAIERAAAELLGLGVRRWVVLHVPEAVFALAVDGAAHWQPSVKMPASAVRGTAGAGDALAAGVLHGLHEQWAMPEILRAAVCVAAASLTDATCSDGVRTLRACLALADEHGWRGMPELAP